MRSVARPRPLDICRNIPVTTYRYIRSNIILIAILTALVIEVTTKKPTGIVRQNGIYANNIAPIRILAFKVTVNVIVSQRLKFAVGTFGAFEFLLVAKLAVPFPTANRLISALSSGVTEPSPCENILAPLKQTAKQRDLLFQRQRRLSGCRFRLVRCNPMTSQQCPQSGIFGPQLA